MPPVRRPLAPTSSNTPHKTEISPYWRGRIVQAAANGQRAAQIARDLDLSDSTVRYTLKQDQVRNHGESLHRAPKKKCYTEADERLLLRHVRLHPKDTYAQVLEACAFDFKTATLKTILKRNGIENRRAKKKPMPTEEDVCEGFDAEKSGNRVARRQEEPKDCGRVGSRKRKQAGE